MKAFKIFFVVAMLAAFGVAFASRENFASVPSWVLVLLLVAVLALAALWDYIAKRSKRSTQDPEA